jgi:hypothetical protein
MDCLKTQYTTEAFALSDIIRIKKKSTRDNVPKRAYFCRLCNFWHLTSQTDKLEERLNTKIAELQEEVKALKAERELFKKTSTEEKALVKADARVLELNNRNGSLQKRNKTITKDNHDLIARNYQLQKKLDSESKEVAMPSDAIEFAEWIAQKASSTLNKDKWLNEKLDIISTKELYELFLTEYNLLTNKI